MSSTTTTIHDLYRAACAADDAWMEAIRTAFPSLRAGDVRYTRQAHGEPDTDLRAAYDRYMSASLAWRESL